MKKKILGSSNFNSVYIKVFIILIIFTIIPMLLVNIFIYRKFILTIEKQTYNTNINILKKTSQMVDEVLIHNGQIIQQLAQDTNIIKSVVDPNIFDSIRNNSIINTIKNVCSMNEYILSIYVYNAYNNTILTSNGGIYKLDEFNDSTWFQSYNKTFLGTHQLDVRTISNLSGDKYNCITLIRNIPYSTWSKIGAIVVNLDEKKLYNLIGFDTEKSGDIYVIDRNGNILLGKDSSILGKQFNIANVSKFMKYNKGFFIENVNGKKNLFTYITSDHNYWKYIHVIPIQDLPNNSKNITQIIFNVTLLYTLFCLTISLIISKGIYNPIKNLMDMVGISPKTDNLPVQNEYQLLGHAYNNILGKNKNMQDTLNKMKPIIKEKLFTNLLIGRSTNIQEINEKLNFLNIDINLENFLVIAMQIDDYKEFLNMFNENDRNLYKINLISIVKQNVPKEYICICIEVESDKVVAIINFPKDIVLMTAKKVTITIAENIQKEVMKNLPFTVTFGIGKIYRDKINIHQSYKEAEESLKYKIYQGKNKIIDIDNLECNTEELYFYNSEKENMLINSLKVGQKNNINIFIDELFEEILHNCNMKYEYLQQEFVRILSSIVEVIIDKGMSVDEVFDSKYYLYKELSTKETITDIKAYITEVCYKVVDAINNINYTKSQKYSEKIIEFIDENSFRDISLNDIADSIGLSSGYVSKIFKENAGKNFTEYLSNIRINKAKQLLKDTHLSVKEIGFKVGFNNIYTFLRTFKKYEGVSPGQFRDIS